MIFHLDYVVINRICRNIIIMLALNQYNCGELLMRCGGEGTDVVVHDSSEDKYFVS